MQYKNLFRLLIAVTLAVTGLGRDAYGQIPNWNPSHSIGTVTGKYAFNYNQTPDQLVEILPAAIPNTGLSYQWESSPTPMPATFTPISVNGGGSSYTVPAPFTQTTYYRRKTMSSTNSALFIYSNIIKISMVSVNWEDLNYVREHGVDTVGITDWKTVDQLPIGEKLQITTYLDGLGRSMERISRETATPTAGGAWGDMVQFARYDLMGRQTRRYYPYTTTTESGHFKSTPLTEQPQYYLNTFNETSAYDSVTFEASPLNRVVNTRQAGTSWAASIGNSAAYDVNSLADSVRIWSVDYVQGDAPVNGGIYPAGTLFKLTYTDVNNVAGVEYRDLSGQIVMKKTQLSSTPSTGHSGWVCTYFVYDDFGLMHFQIQPEGVNYLNSNGWSFAGTNGATVLAEQCFQYHYDIKGRPIWKKLPGQAPLNMLYDVRDRVVFTQDGNQAALSTPQWTAIFYDDLDRTTMRVLYNTTETISALQTDINNAVSVTTVNIPAHTQAPSDLTYDTRNTSITQYVASNSISFVSDAGGSFQTATGDAFVAEIDPTPSTPGYSGTVTTVGSAISSANLANTAVTTILQYLYYDDYTFSGAKSFNTAFTNTAAYDNSNPNVMPIAASQRTLDRSTGSLVRVLGTNTWLGTTVYYDERDRQIQILQDNVKSGTDISTFQYHWDGRIMSFCSNHTAAGTPYTGFITLTKYLFDRLGRNAGVQKQFGSNAFKTVFNYDYDDLGKLKTKHLDPGYNNPNSGGPDLESLTYSFNIHEQITGINKDYALKTSGVYNKWGHFFGQYLGYDNKDNVFSASQLNGRVEGQLWNTQGDDAQRKYEYSYDNAGRLINAAFNQQQHPGDGWSNGQMDFSVSGTSGQMTYDLNGNLLTMLQKGVMPGTATPITIDDLRYTYNAFSNKLQSVTDQMPTTTVNGLSGDLKDGANAAGTPDYVYDNNGNVVVDLNKNVQSLNNGAAGTAGISYNYLDKPDQIRIVGKGTVKIVYDANGQKLQRVYIPESGAPATITTYINQFTYQETAPLTLTSPAPFAGTAGGLSYITFEEGRVRVMTPTSQSNGYDALSENGNIVLPNGQMGVWDYYIQDYQGNLRMILTEETHSASNTCTMETARSSAEDPVFGQTGAANEVESTRFGTPAGWQSVNSSAQVSRLGNIAGHNIGPNTLQKVMAGDLVSASVQYYYQSPSTSSNPNIIPNILNSLGAALGGNATAGTLVHGNGTAITNQLQSVPGFVNAVEPSNSTSGTPQAYLTILFFDERFNFIAAADGGVAQQQVASSWTTSTSPLGLVNIKAPKNGYAYVYVSNRSDQDVYFDNLAVGVTAGNIIEENHYYAYGLRIAGISSRKLGDAGEGVLKNGYLYNGNELYDDGDLNWYDYNYRNYDPQIGRFTQSDPIADQLPVVSNYQYAFDDPITNIDMDGMIGIPCPGTSSLAIFLDKVGEAITDGLSIASPALQYIDMGVNFTNTAMHVETVISNSMMINGQLSTLAAGSYTKDAPPGGDPGGGGGGGTPQTPDPPKLVPFLLFEDDPTTIEIYEHIRDALKDGHPSLLTYDSDKDAANKRSRQALKGYPSKGKLINRDEYPFKCTMEGGINPLTGRRASVREVDALQNQIVGGRLGALIQLMKLKTGDHIWVVLIPSAKRVPVPVPVPDKTYRRIPKFEPAPVLPPGSPVVVPAPSGGGSNKWVPTLLIIAGAAIIIGAFFTGGATLTLAPAL